MTEAEQTTMGGAGIDETILRMEWLYKTLTGTEAPPVGDTTYAPIPAEKDAAEHVQNQLNRLLTMLGEVGPGTVTARPWVPPMSVLESEREIRICLDLAGVKREQVEIAAQGNLLSVKGTRLVATDNGGRLRLNEMAVGPFERKFLVPGGMLAGDPKAQMRDGLLEIRIPKAETAKGTAPYQVPIN